MRGTEHSGGMPRVKVGDKVLVTAMRDMPSFRGSGFATVVAVYGEFGGNDVYVHVEFEDAIKVGGYAGGCATEYELSSRSYYPPGTLLRVKRDNADGATVKAGDIVEVHSHDVSALRVNWVRSGDRPGGRKNDSKGYRGYDWYFEDSAVEPFHDGSQKSQNDMFAAPQAEVEPTEVNVFKLLSSLPQETNT